MLGADFFEPFDMVAPGSASEPGGFVCLLSALAFHALTAQVPHEVWLAVPRNGEPPRLDQALLLN